mmetsp:Transcript_24373/g.29988  ORF Transcript_24373/g.29988 Transcript_24373/m.29988 type:complete len:117 (-) Transcript_24373:13-363(-)
MTMQRSLSTVSRRLALSVSATSTSTSNRFIHVEKRIEELNITLPPPSSPKANYNIICHTTGNIMYVSGHLPIKADGTLLTGRVGPESGGNTVELGYEAARHCGLNIISTLKSQLGD